MRAGRIWHITSVASLLDSRLVVFPPYKKKIELVNDRKAKMDQNNLALNIANLQFDLGIVLTVLAYLVRY